MLIAETDITQWAMNNGLAVVILVLLGAGIWRVFKWLAPKLSNLIEAQISLVVSLQSTTETQTKILEKHGEKLEEIHERVNRCGINGVNHHG